MNHLHRMIVFATERYAIGTQPFRKYTAEPYIVHPVEVMGLILAHADARFHKSPTLEAAIGHDLYEDTSTTREEVVALFGLQTDELIWGLTDQVPRSAGNRKTRKALEAARLHGENEFVQTVKCADLISNSRTIVPLDPGFARTYIPEKRFILEGLTKADPTLMGVAMDMLTAAESALFRDSGSRPPAP